MPYLSKLAKESLLFTRAYAQSSATVLSVPSMLSGVDPAAVEDVVFGCVDTIGHQAGDIARTCWLAAGLPDPQRSAM